MKNMSYVSIRRNFRSAFGLAIVVLLVHAAIAQTRYRIDDLGTLRGGVFGCAMGLNNKGWTEVMDTLLDPGSGNLLLRASVRINGLKIDLGTFGGPNSWTNWGGINERGDAVGYAETPQPDPNGEDFCFFGTQLTCRPFLWHQGNMSQLPTLGGNNGQASAINSRGQISGTAETTMPDAGCPPYQTAPPVLWTKGNAQQLPTIAGDPDGIAFGLNDRGQAVGYTGTCTQALHAVLWDNNTAVELPNLGTESSNTAYAINNRGQVVGQVASADGTTFYAVLWQEGAVTNLGTLPGDFASFATGINDKGQIVGSNLDANFNFTHGFIWQDGVMTDLNTLLPANSYLYVTMANRINSHGQISGMATDLKTGTIHAFLASPVDSSNDEALAARNRGGHAPKANVPGNFRRGLMGPGRGTLNATR